MATHKIDEHPPVPIEDTPDPDEDDLDDLDGKTQLNTEAQRQD